MNYLPLRQELTTDPLALGYSGLSNALAAAKLNDTTTGRTLARTTVPTTEVLGAIANADWPAAASSAENKLRTILAMPYVDASNTNIRGIFQSIFAAGATRTALLTLATQTVSRAVELGLGSVTEGDVAIARGGVW